MPDFRRTALLAASAAAAIALVTACDPSGTTDTAGGTTAPAASAPANPSEPSSSAPSAPAGGGTGLQTANSSTLGTIVTDGSGYTLYRFDKDTAKPPVSNCNGDCAKLWPPVMASDNPQLKGIDAKLVSTVTRADGSKQVTLNGWPLYRYTPDTKPGDTKGQGVKGTWWAVTPTGGKAAAAASPATGGYGY
ncbi:hypothetical protein [Kitasatospora sp. NPDC093679]|uniref:hypothetical protein n=1 Tax=Kitasatospora sp. NPDC093679 TaxID=3154983 RepID=UPI0034427A5B